MALCSTSNMPENENDKLVDEMSLPGDELLTSVRENRAREQVRSRQAD